MIFNFSLNMTSNSFSIYNHSVLVDLSLFDACLAGTDADVEGHLGILLKQFLYVPIWPNLIGSYLDWT